jgi:hypothetical protein
MKLTTLERMAKMEQKLDDVCADLTEIKATIKDFIESADSKYAPRWVADLMKTGIGIITVSALGFLVWVLQQYLSTH